MKLAILKQLTEFKSIIDLNKIYKRNITPYILNLFWYGYLIRVTFNNVVKYKLKSKYILQLKTVIEFKEKFK